LKEPKLQGQLILRRSVLSHLGDLRARKFVSLIYCRKKKANPDSIPIDIVDAVEQQSKNFVAEEKPPEEVFPKSKGFRKR
jgi:hypothetical protein